MQLACKQKPGAGWLQATLVKNIFSANKPTTIFQTAAPGPMMAAQGRIAPWSLVLWSIRGFSCTAEGDCCTIIISRLTLSHSSGGKLRMASPMTCRVSSLNSSSR
jgi:hypothetical protein